MLVFWKQCVDVHVDWEHVMWHFSQTANCNNGQHQSVITNQVAAAWNMEWWNYFMLKPEASRGFSVIWLLYAIGKDILLCQLSTWCTPIPATPTSDTPSQWLFHCRWISHRAMLFEVWLSWHQFWGSSVWLLQDVTYVISVKWLTVLSLLEQHLHLVN